MMGNSRKISIIIPVYENVSNLILILKALLDQTARSDHYEVLVIDDGSQSILKDGLPTELRQINNFFHFRHEFNRGRSAARNTGISNASGEVLVFVLSAFLAQCAPRWVATRVF